MSARYSTSGVASLRQPGVDLEIASPPLSLSSPRHVRRGVPLGQLRGLVERCQAPTLFAHLKWQFGHSGAERLSINVRWQIEQM
jgi:hypothetical protein